jgi:hypothetical protein
MGTRVAGIRAPLANLTNQLGLKRVEAIIPDISERTVPAEWTVISEF